MEMQTWSNSKHGIDVDVVDDVVVVGGVFQLNYARLFKVCFVTINVHISLSVALNVFHK